MKKVPSEAARQPVVGGRARFGWGGRAGGRPAAVGSPLPKARMSEPGPAAYFSSSLGINSTRLHGRVR